MKISQRIVDRAYERVLSAGDKPTVRRVQDELEIIVNKRGSMDDIARMLRLCKAGDGKPLRQRITELETKVKDMADSVGRFEDSLERIEKLLEKCLSTSIQ